MLNVQSVGEKRDSATGDLTFAFSYTEADVVGQTTVASPTGPILPVSASNIEDIENNYPNERAVVTLNTLFGDNLSLMVRANYYGKHWDERGDIGGSAEDDGGDPAVLTGFCCVNKSWEVGATIYIDAQVGYQINDNWHVALGGNNIFDEFGRVRYRAGMSVAQMQRRHLLPALRYMKVSGPSSCP